MGNVGIAYNCEGAGHATRMLGVATALENRGITPSFSGGGPGMRFIEMNGYTSYAPTSVHYIKDLQTHNGGLFLRNPGRSVKRIYESGQWISQHAFELVVTDDPHAAIAAFFTDTPFFFIKHDPATMYPFPERLFQRITNHSMVRMSNEFFVPTVWQTPTPRVPGATSIPPLAHELPYEPDVSTHDILLVPSAYSPDQTRQIEETLTAADYSVTRVGGEDWEAVPSLMPHIRSSNLVICSGYSTVMEAAIAGTPCIITPMTSEQRAVAATLTDCDAQGFTVCHNIETLAETVQQPPTARTYQNGVEDIANTVVSFLQNESGKTRNQPLTVLNS